jgi:uncharacterized DUF497 family protein
VESYACYGDPHNLFNYRCGMPFTSQKRSRCLSMGTREQGSRLSKKGLILALNVLIFEAQVDFEFDPQKNALNKASHGIDFATAKELWNDPNALIVPSRKVKEIRFARIAELNGRIWCAIFTYRQNNVRLISVRRAHGNEEREYKNPNR